MATKLLSIPLFHHHSLGERVSLRLLELPTRGSLRELLAASRFQGTEDGTVILKVALS